MKPHLPKKLFAALIAAFVTFTQACGTTLDNAVLFLEDFSEASLSAAEDQGWTFANVYDYVEGGIYTSTYVSAIIHNDNDWANRVRVPEHAERALWSAIVQVDGESLLNAGTSGTIIENFVSYHGYEGAGFSNGKLTGAWNNSTYSGLTLSEPTLAQCENAGGTITLGIVYLGEEGTTVYMVDGQKRVFSANSPNLKSNSGNFTEPMDIRLSNTEGIGYKSLYLFGDAVSTSDMTAMLQGIVNPLPTPPAPYTSVVITTESQLSPYTSSDYIAFLIGANITDSTYRMTGKHQYWTDNSPRTHSLTFSELENSEKGAAIIVSAELVMKNMKALSFNKNSSSKNLRGAGGAVYGENSSMVTLSGNESVTFSGNSAMFDGGAIYGEANSVITLNSNDAVAFSANSASSYRANGGAIYAKGTVNLTDNDEILFSVNFISGSGENSFCGGAIYASTINITGNKCVELNENYATSFNGTDYGFSYSSARPYTYTYGGAIYASSIILSSNESVSFRDNYASTSANSQSLTKALCYTYGGAIYASSIGFMCNESVEFSGNSASSPTGLSCSFGGAVATEVLNITDNKSVSFSGNFAACSVASAYGGDAYGGAIYASDANLAGNSLVTFSGNYASSTDISHGGAIYTTGSLNLMNNKSLMFSENYACGTTATSSTFSYGGAIYASNITLANNESVTFHGNFASTKGTSWSYEAYGGAIYASEALTMTNNKSVEFSGNYADAGDVCGGAICAASTIKFTRNGSVAFRRNSTGQAGGALYATTIYITDNESVNFCGNRAYTTKSALAFEVAGGAVYTSSISITGNKQVVFRGNYEQRDTEKYASCQLRSVYVKGDNGGIFTLAAGMDQDIVFYDTLFVGSGTAVSFNDKYADQKGNMQNASGDIVFCGTYSECDLKELNPDYTLEDLTNSLTSEVYATTNLYGGRLRVEDGAIYKGNGINVAAHSNATLRLAAGTLEQSGYDVLLNAGTILELEGKNSITASTLEMMDGSTLSFNMGSQEGALLSLNGILETGKITIALSGNMQNAHELINLADVSQYDTSMWTEQRIAVSGTNFKHLVWNNGILSYTGIIESHIELDNDKEIADFDGGDIVDIEGNKHKLTVKHPVDLVHLAMENGVVRLEGESNNVVRITLTENGTLELAAGAKLNVGNIVSMVANQSANIVISGDIEITDAELYGTNGRGTLSYASMTITDDYTIKDVDISGSFIKLEEGATLYIKNVNISADSRITDDTARLFIEGGTAILDESNTEASAPTMSLADVTFYRSGDTETWVTLQKNVSLVSLTSDVFTKVMLTGTDLWLDLTGLSAQVGDATAFSISFEDGALFDVDSLRVYATLNGEKYLDGYTTQQSGGATTLYFSKQIPEPTTGSLSLLALAALAARRRRTR